MAKYGKAASASVRSAVRRQKQGTLKSGSGRRVASRKQAVAIGLSEARKKGAKVPPDPSSSGGRSTRTARRSATRSRSGSTSRRRKK